MKPALSVILFTVLSGAGLGFLSLLIPADIAGLGGGFERVHLELGGLGALALNASGLVASTLHLASPRKAWRAFSQFRHSWLSREAVFAVLLFPAAFGWIAAVHLEANWSIVMPLGFSTVALAWAVLFCTGMIYACLKTVPQWHTPYTPVNYLLLGHAAGSLLLLLLAELGATSGAGGPLQTPYIMIVLMLLLAAAGGKAAYYRRYRAAEGKHGLHDALPGLKTQAAIRLLDAGHSHDTFLDREFVYRLGARHAGVLRGLALVLAFIVPLASLIGAWRGVAALVAAVLCCLAGMLIERWLFFAEAQHVVRLYHGQQRV
ncbi:MAG: DMSO reductase [Betaproteobacteria bacterium]|nr:DMSO reductase [Betaproteobacteria bacterium]